MGTGDGEAPWPLPVVLRVMPPIPVYDHKSMRETGRPRQHVVDPETLDRTLCGKDFALWRVCADPLVTFDSAYFAENGCATCARVAANIMEGRPRRAASQGTGEL